MDITRFHAAFFEESREGLDTMESGLLGMEAGRSDADTINAIFRAAHTLKGSSGMFNLQLVVSFTHLLENLLVRVRSGEQPMDGALISLLLSCGDYLSRLFDKVALGLDDEDPDPALRAELSAALAGYLGEVQVLKPLAGVPVRGNAQDWRWLVVTDPAKRAALAEIYNRIAAPYFAANRASIAERGVTGMDSIMDSGEYLGTVLHEVPVHIVPCIYGRPEGEAAELLGIPAGVHQAALLPVARYTGDDFKPGRRRPVEEVTYWDSWKGAR